MRVIALRTHDYVTCRTRTRRGSCNTLVPLPEDGTPISTCPRCRQPMPWLGTFA